MPQHVLAGHTPEGQPVYVEVLTPEEIRQRLTQTDTWKRFCERFDMTAAPNLRLINWLFGAKLDENSQLENYEQLLNDVSAAGGILEIDETQYEFQLTEAPEPEPEGLRDKNGKPLSEAQIRWSEYRKFAESHSMKECRERSRTDAGFASFVEKNLQREMAGGVGDEGQNLNARPQTTKQITPELQAWAIEYRNTPNQRVRQLCRADFNPAGYIAYIDNLNAAIAAGLI